MISGRLEKHKTSRKGMNNKYNNAVSFIIGEDNKGDSRVLMIVNNGDRLNLPGGRRDRTDPDSIFTSIRETREETEDSRSKTGLDLSKMRHFSSYVNEHSNGTVTIVNIFKLGSPIKDLSKSITNTETKGYLWFRLSYLKKLLKDGTLDENFECDALAKKYKIFGPCIGTFKKMHKDSVVI